MIPKTHKLVHQFLENSTKHLPDKIALIHEGARFTYSEINTMSDHLARHLISQDVQKGDRIVMIFHNSIEYIVSYYGIIKAGAIAVPLSTEIKPDALRPVLNELEPKALISSSRFEKILQDTDLTHFGIRVLIISDPKLSWTSYPFKFFSWSDIINKNKTSSPSVSIDESDLASIIYTSGSVGTPKGVMLSHKNITSNTESICEYLHLTDNDIQMVVLPFFYVMGKSLLNTHFAIGGTVVLNNKFAFTASVINQMIEEKVTGFSGVPSTYAYLLHRSPLKSARDKLVSLRYCSQAGGHMSKQIKIELRKALPKHTDIFIMYGATEASARLTYLSPDCFTDKVDSIGKAIKDVTIKILDENGMEVPATQVGEITGAGPNIMLGYWRDPETTSKVLDKNGYHTGDLGYQDEEGFFYLVGRRDNLLKVSGHRINPQEIEDILMETGLVMEVAVVGIPDHLLGNKLIAIITPIDDNCTGKEIIDKCASKLPRYKIPGDIIITRSLPKKANGKIDKQKCREMVSKNQDV